MATASSTASTTRTTTTSGTRRRSSAVGRAPSRSGTPTARTRTLRPTRRLPAIDANHCPDGVLLGVTPWRPFEDDAGEPPLRRWPLYHDARYSGAATTTPQAEIWDGVPAVDQVLPLRQPGDARPGLQHPLL